jgi:hypothetical protein
LFYPGDEGDWVDVVFERAAIEQDSFGFEPGETSPSAKVTGSDKTMPADDPYKRLPKADSSGTIDLASVLGERVVTSTRAASGDDYFVIDDYRVTYRVEWSELKKLDSFALSLPHQGTLTSCNRKLIKATHSVLGDVLEELALQDDVHVTLGSNEKIELWFESEMLPDGLERSYVFESVGRYYGPAKRGPVAASDVGTKVPLSAALHPAAPNPGPGSTTISFSVPYTCQVEVCVFGLRGQLVRRLVDEEYAPGKYSITWDGKNERGSEVGSGVYFYRATMNGFSDTKRVVLLK